VANFNSLLAVATIAFAAIDISAAPKQQTMEEWQTSWSAFRERVRQRKKDAKEPFPLSSLGGLFLVANNGCVTAHSDLKQLLTLRNVTQGLAEAGPQ